MTENSSDHSEAVRKYIDSTPESTFEFDRLGSDEEGLRYDSERIGTDESE
ncbi:hypothetical protein NGM10_07425 [Halorussus salilacus]|nr:hypothetical protein [Halorussus salilacus]USZ69553.1 hypothetical protein NGM10_07425 [Halorussus salilacus]